ncbi:hypothetical protein DID75_03370 [Candidatus Marinamargulisbacteria bacterium SCGC AG-410-N11]|nr:hypothetical protein DID75_03370 [Candidatus Marinamargulisbacteria bacterium SCGC AG-410-N11]
MADQFLVLIVLFPLFVGLLIPIIAYFNKSVVWPLAILSLIGSFWAVFNTATQLLKLDPSSSISYYLGNWMAPFGIEYVVDRFNIMVLFAIICVSLLTTIFAKQVIEKELGDNAANFYSLFLLFITGLLGITITGDAFNLYVLLEIASLTSYGLIALGRGRALVATFNYLIMGSMGACFYLLGVGYLFIKTGTLNMDQLYDVLPLLFDSKAVLVGFVFIILGMWVKMAFFPLHSWLPNAYSLAPTAAACLMAPLMTKVSVYVMIRFMLNVFSTEYVYSVLTINNIIVIMSSIAIIAGSIYALSQKNLKKMLTFIIVAEIGYMVGGVWTGHVDGIRGAIYHITADAFMTLCLFMAVGCIVYRVGNDKLESLKGIFKKMPITMICFLVGGFSVIGIPPTCGFFSKWYLISGAFNSGAWYFIIALIISSLINAVLFFRIIEIGFFGAMSNEKPDYKSLQSIKFNEVPINMWLPLVIVSMILIILGIYTNEIMTNFILNIVPMM